LRRLLHRLNDARAYTLLAQKNQVCGLQRSRYSMRTHMRHNVFFRNAGTRHGNDIVRRHGSGIHRSPHARCNLGPVLGFDIVERSADGGTTDRANASANRRTCGRISHRVPNDRSHPCAT
jgi:hypothetical protein